MQQGVGEPTPYRRVALPALRSLWELQLLREGSEAQEMGYPWRAGDGKPSPCPRRKGSEM